MEKWQSFLSDLCGREVRCAPGFVDNLFLSDLCGREELQFRLDACQCFLSDLCGREEADEADDDEE